MELALNSISILLVTYAVIFIVWRVISNSGFAISHKTKNTPTAPHTTTPKECTKVFLYALMFRLIVLAVGVLIQYVFTEMGEFDLLKAITNFKKWDAHAYLNITHGYDFVTENGDFTSMAFFPVYPLLIKIASLFISNLEISGLIVSALCFALACVFIFKLICLDYSKKTAYIALLLISLYPFSFFFGGIMSESAFLLFSSITLYYIRKHNWLIVGIAGFFTALTRNVGVILVFPAFIEILEEYQVLHNLKNRKFLLDIFFKKLFPLLLIPLGTVVYLFINYKISGDWFYFIGMQEKYWHNNFTPFYHMPYSLINWINYPWEYNYNIILFIPNLVSTIIMYTILTFSVRRQKTMYSIYFLAYIIICTSISWPMSLNRYFTCALPAFISLANLLEKKPVLCNFTLISFGMLFMVYYTGYLMDMSIM